MNRCVCACACVCVCMCVCVTFYLSSRLLEELSCLGIVLSWKIKYWRLVPSLNVAKELLRVFIPFLIL